MILERTLQDAIQQYTPPTESIRAAEDERARILQLFPRDAWVDLPLERYALGQDDPETFCNLMEFGSSHLGSISGGSSMKMLIFKRRRAEGWYFDDRYPSVERAWQEVRAGFADAFALAAAGEWERIDTIESIYKAPALRTKALHLYFENDILPIYSEKALLHFLELLGDQRTNIRSLDRTALNRRLLARLRAEPALSMWSPMQLGYFLYQWNDPRERTRVVKIAPGDDAKFWSECLEGGYVCVAWDEVGDLRSFEDRDAFRRTFGDRFGNDYNQHEPTITRKANEVWTLIELEPGDLIIANKGTSRVLAVGEVQAPGYEYREDRESYKHTVRVRWDTSYGQEIPPQKKWAMVTVDSRVPRELYERIIATHRGGTIAPVTTATDPLFAEIAAGLARRKQAIVYGPPGTGKTYITRRFAAWWLTRTAGVDVLASDEAVENAEQELKAAGRLRWITFHPSYAYEDFVEGIRPVRDDDRYSLAPVDGVFKEFCSEARKNPESPYLLVIDEINRANVAKVFGELITLIESDKRGMSIVLPLSRAEFSIPKNVYILGSMNTADRSIRLLDSAMRRRFAFIELMPDAEVLGEAEVDGVALSELLKTINRRIVERDGREKQIGHSVFMTAGRPHSDAADLARAVRQELLPLLQEYCYGDYARLRHYVGEDIVSEDGRLNEELVEDDARLVLALAALTR